MTNVNVQQLTADAALTGDPSTSSTPSRSIRSPAPSAR
jgi:hypothetical protein